MDRYEFYKNKKGKLICNAVINGESVSYFDEDALYFFRRLGKEKFSSFRFERKKKKENVPPKLIMSNDYNTVVCNDCYKFRKDLNECYGKNRSDINSKLDKNKLVIVVSVGIATIGAIEGFMIGNHDHMVELQQEASKKYAGSKISYSVENNELDDDDDEIELMTFDDYTDTEQYHYVYDNYHDICEEIGNRYGVSPNLLIAMITQESGGRYKNLMQIEYDNNKDQVHTLYNFETGMENKFVLTDNPDAYGDDVTTISSTELEDPKNNLSIASSLLQDCLKYADGNILLGVSTYNIGVGNMNKILNEASRVLGKSIDELKNGDYNEIIGFMDIGEGDSDYPFHVLRYANGKEVMIRSKNVDYVFTFNKEANHSPKTY